MTKAVDLVGAKVLAVEIVGLVGGVSVLAVQYTITEVGALVAILGTVIVNIIMARAAARKSDMAATEAKAIAIAAALKVEAATTVLHEVSAKTEAIKTSVDGASHVQKTEIDVLRAEMTMMRELLSDEKERAAKLAQAAATALASPAVLAPPPAIGTAEGSLISIDDTTKAIEENTAATKETVEGVKANVDALKDPR